MVRKRDHTTVIPATGLKETKLSADEALMFYKCMPFIVLGSYDDSYNKEYAKEIIKALPIPIKVNQEYLSNQRSPETAPNTTKIVSQLSVHPAWCKSTNPTWSNLLKRVISHTLSVIRSEDHDLMKQYEELNASTPTKKELMSFVINCNTELDFFKRCTLVHTVPTPYGYTSLEEIQDRMQCMEDAVTYYKCFNSVFVLDPIIQNSMLKKEISLQIKEITFHKKVIENKEVTIARLNLEIADLKEQLRIAKSVDMKETDNPACRILPKVRNEVKEEPSEEILKPIKEIAPFKALINGSPWDSQRRVRKVGILASISSKNLNRFSKTYNHLKITLYDAFEKTAVIKQMLNEDCLIVMTEYIPHNVTDAISSASDLPIIYINRGAGQKLEAAFDYINKLGS